MTTKHTPGPWTADHAQGSFRDIRVHADQEQAFDLATVHNGGGEGETAANARLIAAAPELLEACDRAVALLTHPHSTRDGRKEAELATFIRSAIAKAEGGAK